MNSGSSNRVDDRRKFLSGLAGLPALYATPALMGWPVATALARPEFAVPESAADALDVFQLKAVARQKLSPEVFHFIATGADDGFTVEENHAAFRRIGIRVRRMVDVSGTRMDLQLFGQSLPSPILFAPVGNQQGIHQDGELASARAAGRSGHGYIVSNMTNFSVEEISAETRGPVWFQLYPSPSRPQMEFMIRRAEAAGCTVLVVTVDGAARSNRTAQQWFRKHGQRQPSPRLGNFEGWSEPPRIGDPTLTWDFVDWLREQTDLPIVFKGIVTAEDAEIAADKGLDGLVVSNHGGRQEESYRATVDCLPEVVEGAAGRLTVLLDGGIRRGTDAFKALALGADAVCVGRAPMWGLGAFGQSGVERAQDLLDRELLTIMKQAGTTSVDAISRDYLALK